MMKKQCFMSAKAVLTAALAATICGGLTNASYAKPTGDLVRNISINGSGLDLGSNVESTLSGVVSLSSIDYDSASGNFQFTGTLNGSVSADGVTTEILFQLLTTTGTLTGEMTGKKGKCDILNLDLAPTNLDLLGLQVDLSAVELDIAGQKGPGRLLGNLLCQLTGLLDSGTDAIDRQLGRINSIISSPLDNIAVSGVANTSGTFTGFITVESLAVDGQGNLLANGVINGVATLDSLTTTVVNQAFSAPLALDGSNGGGKGKKCSILSLDLGPLNLDLLGLQIDLSEVVLDISGATGSGKLLGNLLCNITHVLDKGANGKPDKLVKSLTKSIQKINQELLRL